jgi:hypothetical protein
MARELGERLDLKQREASELQQHMGEVQEELAQWQERQHKMEMAMQVRVRWRGEGEGRSRS